MLLRDQESCVINSGTTTKSFSLRRGASFFSFFIYFSFKDFSYNEKLKEDKKFL